MKKEKVLKIKLSTLIIIILIALLPLLSFLLYRSMLLNKNKESYSKKSTESIQSSTEILNNGDKEISNNFSENNVISDINNRSVDTPTTKQLVENTREEPTEEVVADVDEETIRTLFSKYLDTFKTRRETDSLKITDYSIPTITIYTGETKARIVEEDFGQYYKITDTLADVYYDVRPYDINNCSGWFAGKEPIEDGNWLRGKHLFVRVRNGVLEVIGTSF